MSVRTTVTLDEDVLERVKKVSQSRGISFKNTLNSLLRAALIQSNQIGKRTLRVIPRAWVIGRI
ncbi:MAG TPA: hypothetical protein VGL97_19895 [Bryobacteraceae bacterium]|jgi:hypothetical protein